MKKLSGLPESTVKSLSWIPLVALNVYVMGFNIGLGEIFKSVVSLLFYVNLVFATSFCK